MVIFMPHYRQHGQLFHSHSRTRPSTTSNGQNNNNKTTTTTANPLNGCQFACSLLCRVAFSLFLLIIALFLFRLSIDNTTNQKEGSPIIAAILLTIAIISFIRTYQKLRQYYIIMDTRRRLIQRLRERQQAYDLTLSLNNNENPEHIRNTTTDLPSYKELFPSHLDISNSGNDLPLPPPSYDDYVKTLIIRHTTTSLPQSHTLSLSNISSQSQTNPTRCIWITDRTQRPLCIRGTVTYV